MLDVCGVSSIDELFSVIPESLKSPGVELPEHIDEYELDRRVRNLASLNKTPVSFCGGGMYEHFIPAAVDSIAGKAEFYTPYTPYQPECSQGTLQTVYELQTALCRLYGMEASNASVYDGATAVAEAALMAVRVTRRRKIIVDGCLNPLYIRVLKTYLRYADCEIVQTGRRGAGLSEDGLEAEIDEKTACYIYQNPDFFGNVRDLSSDIKKVHSAGALAVASAYPVSLGLLKTPGEMGADIATGEGQSLGNPLNFSGPYIGFITCKRKYIRKLPGRIVAETEDTEGRRGFVLTLQTREQHIRRARATSNICTNQNHCGLRSLIYMTLMGKNGMREIAISNAKKASYACEKFKERGFAIENPGPIFNEFVVNIEKDAEDVLKNLYKRGFLGGVPLGKYFPDMKNCVLIAVTEVRSLREIEEFIGEFEKSV